MTTTIPYGGFPGGFVDTLIGLPTDHRRLYETMRRQLLRDSGSQDMAMPAEHMFKDVPIRDDEAPADPVAVTLAEMDRVGMVMRHGAEPDVDLAVKLMLKWPNLHYSLERIFGELPGVPFKDDVWPGFLRNNAARLLGLEER